MTAERRHRVALIGAGIMGRVHGEVLRSLPGVTLHGVWSKTRQRAEETARLLGCPVRDWEEMIADPEVDMVAVSTPDHAHRRYAEAAARAGKHVLVEKPLATTVEDARAVVRAAREAGVVLMTLYNHRFVPAYWTAWERLQAGDLGRPLLAHARKNDRIYVPTRMISWAASTTPAHFLSSHDVDLVTWLLQDRPVEVVARKVARVLTGRGVATPDAVVMQVAYAGGAVATFESCWIYPDTFPTLTDSFLEVVAERGVIHVDRKVEQVEIADTHRVDYPRTQLLVRVAGQYAGAVATAIRHFVEAVDRGQAPLITPESSLTVTAVLEAAHRSMETGRPEAVEEERP